MTAAPRTDDPAHAGLVAALAPFLAAEELPARLAQLTGERSTALRVNRLCAESPSVTEELAGAGLQAEPVPWCPDALLLPPGSQRAVQTTDAHAAGKVYVQGLSSQVAPLALAPESGMRVLDLCAAPGSKTSQLAALLGGGDGLHANERSRTRIHRLRSVLNQLGVTGVTLSSRPGQSFGRTHPAAFDAVLVDAPCSMEGRLRIGDPHAADPTPRGRIRRLAGEQRALLSAAVTACAPGGVIVYATCTLAVEENERVLDKLLRRRSDDVQLEALPVDVPDALPGRTVHGERPMHPDLIHARRLLPDATREGFFIARLRRLG